MFTGLLFSHLNIGAKKITVVSEKPNKSWGKKMREFGEQREEAKKIAEYFKCGKIGHKAKECQNRMIQIWP